MSELPSRGPERDLLIEHKVAGTGAREQTGLPRIGAEEATVVDLGSKQPLWEASSVVGLQPGN